MSALNSLPLPVVRLLAFFHEELSERRPGRVPQTVQLWVGSYAGNSDLDDL